MRQGKPGVVHSDNGTNLVGADQEVRHKLNQIDSVTLRRKLAERRAHTKWSGKKRNVQVDNLVLVIEHMMPRNEWFLGRVVEALPGPDGLVLSIRVMMSGAAITRPRTELCVLEEADAHE